MKADPRYDDTHATEAQLAALDGNCFDLAVMTDEQCRCPRFLFNHADLWRREAPGRVWRRLVVHVPSINEPGLDAHLLAAMGVKLMDVPF